MNEYWLVLLEVFAGGIVSILIWYFKKMIARMEERDERRKQQEQNILDRITNLEEAIFELHNRLDEQIRKELERLAIEEERHLEFSKMKDGIEAMMRIEIAKSRRYFMGKGYIPPDEFENITQMFHSYEELGGNGVTKKNYHDIENLPFEPPSSVENPAPSVV